MVETSAANGVTKLKHSGSGATCAALVAFTFLWGQLQAAHMLKDLHWQWEHLQLLPVLALTCVLPAVLSPQTSFALPMCAWSSLVYLLVHGSRSNHIVLDLLVNLAVITTSFPATPWKSMSFHRIALVVHRELWVLYLITAVHKLNYDWFDPSVSCASSVTGILLAQYIPSAFPANSAMTSSVLQGAPYAAVLLEFALPGLLIVSGPPGLEHRSTLSRLVRPIVVILGVAFHLSLALPLPPASFYPFSASCLVMYVLELPQAWEKFAFYAVDRAPYLTQTFWKMLPGFLILPALANAGGHWSDWVRQGETSTASFEYPPYDLYNAGICWIFCVSLLLVLLAILDFSTNPNPNSVGSGDDTLPSKSRTGVTASVICLGALLVVGLGPYIGTRTYPAFAMFSNLRVEGGAPNHIVFGGGFDMFGFHGDSVLVMDTNSTVLKNLQVDLARLYTAKTSKYLVSAGIHATLWICPPKWRYAPAANFTPFSVPAVEFRRRLALEPLKSSTRVRRDGKEFIVHDVADIALHCPSWMSVFLCEWAASFVGPFRSFDESWSPCRH